MKHPLNIHFDTIYVLYINKQEKNRIIHKLNKKNIKVKYFKGIYGNYEKDKYAAYLRYFNLHFKNDKNAYNLNPGSFGHISSTINILKDAIKNKYNKILILEPDIYFCNDFDKRCLKYLKIKYKILYFGCSQNKFYHEDTWNKIDSTINTKKGFYFAYKTLGTFAIGLDKSIFGEYLNLLQKLKAPTDVNLIELQKKYNKKCIVCFPNIICCDTSVSNTSSGKNQLATIENFKWTLNYVFEDLFSFQTEYQSWYELEIIINSNFKNHHISIYDDNNKLIIPKLTAEQIKKFKKNNKISIYFYTNTNNISIILFCIFCNNVMIKKMDKRYIKTKFPLNFIRLIRNTDIGKYYIKNIFSA